MMTFENLHRDTDCDCLSHEGVAENTSDTFLRRVSNAPPTLEDFASYYEEGRRIEGDFNDCALLCKYRGVSMNKLDGVNEKALQSKWAEIARFKPKMPRIVCKFKFKDDAGMVWETPARDNQSHCTLLKADQFRIELLEVIGAVHL